MLILAYIAFLFGAFWVAVGMYRGRDPWRFLGALVAGASFAHIGWIVLQDSSAVAPPRALLDLTTGYSILFFPLGPLLLSRRDPAAWKNLPLALAVARAGCWWTGCCRGVDTAWGNHPMVLYEIFLMALLYLLLRTIPRQSVGWVFLLGFGSARLVIEPFRISSATLVPVEWLAGSWVVVAMIWAIGSARGLDPTLSSLSGCGGIGSSGHGSTSH